MGVKPDEPISIVSIGRGGRSLDFFLLARHKSRYLWPVWSSAELPNECLLTPRRGPVEADTN